MILVGLQPAGQARNNTSWAGSTLSPLVTISRRVVKASASAGNPGIPVMPDT
ncbi:hypothetical protein GCM10022226_43540 [Sphaerisporangium flaviroseum]|uniref:Uncharacterized protein n=1 Tax=Sphaerisporangium flaviroseum TaxID=509199 RepID=A0ABP7IHA3_9ACTN